VRSESEVALLITSRRFLDFAFSAINQQNCFTGEKKMIFMKTVLFSIIAYRYFYSYLLKIWYLVCGLFFVSSLTI